MNGHSTTALILSGGGAFAAYEVGVLKALSQGVPATGGQPLDIDIVTGTSAGGFNAAVILAQADAASPAIAKRLEQVWLDEVAGSRADCGNGVFRWRVDPATVFNIGCFLRHPQRFVLDAVADSSYLASELLARAQRFGRETGSFERRILELFDLSVLVSTSPFLDLIRRTVSFDAVRRSRREIRIAATNWNDGTVRIFSKDDMTDALGPRIIQASAAVPGFFPPITVGLQVFVDGGVLMNTPLLPAINLGADVFHVVFLDPDLSQVPLERLQTALGVLQRALAVNNAANFNRDILTAAEINRGLAVLAGAGAPSLGSSEEHDYVRILGKAVRRLAASSTLRPLTIHRYHPRDELGSTLGFMDFERETVARLITRGYEDTMRHDCDASGCVFPGLAEAGGTTTAPKPVSSLVAR